MTSAIPEKNTLTDASAVIPDIRASLCHTIMAAGFLLINLQNPFREKFVENWVELSVMLALPLVIGLSWTAFFRRLRMWQQLTPEQQNTLTRTPDSLRTRAISHLLMAFLATGLTTLGYLGYVEGAAKVSPGLPQKMLLIADALVGIIAIAVVSRSVRDLIDLARKR